MKVVENINSRLEAIFNDRSLSPEQRGEMGEELVFEICKLWISKFDDTYITSSVIFPQGEVLKSKDRVEEDPVTEIDILMVTHYRIFVLEVKTIYGSMHIKENYEMSGDNVNRNFFQQNEMHARHLYWHLNKILPYGDPRYIVPILAMTGNMEITDERSVVEKVKNPCTVSSELYQVLDKLNKPFKYGLDVRLIKKKMEKIRVHDKTRLLNSQKFK